MKNKGIYYIMVGIICCIIMTGCVPKYYTDELLEGMSKEYTQKGEMWFEENLPEANVVAIQLQYSYSSMYSLVVGSFVYEGEEYNYILNPDTGILYTDRNYDVAKTTAEQLILEQIDFDIVSMECTKYASYEIPCQEIINMTSGLNPHEIDLQYKDTFIYAEYVPWDYEKAQINAWVKDMLKTESDLYTKKYMVKINMEDYSVIEEGENMYKLIETYPGIKTINFYSDSLKDSEYYVVYSENANQITRHYKDDNGKWKYERIKY